MINTDTYILPGMCLTCLCHLNVMLTEGVTPISSIAGDHVFMHRHVLYFSFCLPVCVNYMLCIRNR